MNRHYTTLLHLPYILESGSLRASRRTAHGDHDAGLLWFSINSIQEASAIKGTATPVRLSYSGEKVTSWQRVAKSVGFSSAVIRRLERSGRQMGAKPGEWRALVGDVALDDIDAIEVSIAGGWHAVERDALRVTRLKSGAVQLHGPGGVVATVARQRTIEGYFAYATCATELDPGRLLADDSAVLSGLRRAS